MLLCISILLLFFLIVIFINKKIEWYHFIWALLPIDMYGLKLFGVTIKPYMIFGLVIIICSISNFIIKARINNNYVAVSRENLHYRFVIFVCNMVIFFLMLCSDIFNGATIGSLLQQFMWLFIVFIAYTYMCNVNQYGQWKNAYIAICTTTKVYISFFILSYLLITLFNNSDLLALSRFDSGLFIKFDNSNLERLRGYFIDSNTLFTSLSIGVSALILNVISAKRKISDYMWLALAVFIVYLTNSRNTLINFLFIFIFLLLCYRPIRKMSIKNIMIVTGILMVGLIIFSHIDIYSSVIEWYQVSYSEHSELGAQYGRFSIWRNNLSIIKNDLLFGMGQGLLRTVSYRDFHNTWFEVLGANGILVTIFYMFPIFFVLHKYIKHRKKAIMLGNDSEKMYFSLIAGYIGVLISLSTVSNINNSYLIFATFILSAGGDVLRGLDNV